MPHPCLHPVNRTAKLLALILAAASLAGCQGIAGIQPVSQVRVIDVSPDAPALDIRQTSSQAFPSSLYNIGFGTVSSYIPLTSGAWTNSAFTSGTQQQLAAVRGSFADGGQYTLLTGNILASLQMTVLRDQSTPAPAGQVELRFLNQATRSGSVDLFLQRSGTDPGTLLPIASNAAFGSNTGYIHAPAGTYSLVVLPSGSGANTVVAPRYTGSQITFPSGSVRTILLVDEPSTAHALQIITADDFDPSAS